MAWQLFNQSAQSACYIGNMHQPCNNIMLNDFFDSACDFHDEMAIILYTLLFQVLLCVCRFSDHFLLHNDDNFLRSCNDI